MKKSLLLTLLMLAVIFLVSCEKNMQEERISPSPVLVNNREKCVFANSDGEMCRPNLHRFFGNPEEYLGMEVVVSGFATYSPRGSILIYPNSVSACDALDFSGIEVFSSSEISKGLEDRLRVAGVARVIVTGHVASVDLGALSVIGRIDKASVVPVNGAGVVSLENPRKIRNGEVINTSFGKLVMPTCLKP
jgi:hypothetical protein